MEWNYKVIIEFLDLYKEEPALWNPRNPFHKDRSYVYDAWKRIQTNISIKCSLEELKKKKENLMATYRKLAVRVNNNQIYKPEWFAFNKMASFLHTVYIPRKTKTLASLKASAHPAETLTQKEGLRTYTHFVKNSRAQKDSQPSTSTVGYSDPLFQNDDDNSSKSESSAPLRFASVFTAEHKTDDDNDSITIKTEPEFFEPNLDDDQENENVISGMSQGTTLDAPPLKRKKEDVFSISTKKETESYLERHVDEDEIETFGKSVTAQMRKLPEKYAIEAMAEIQTVLSQKRLQYLAETKKCHEPS